jgi:hypothetical protein
MAIFFKAAITGIIAAGLLLAGAGGASAEEQKPYTTVVWQMPSWAGENTATWGDGQSFVAEVQTDEPDLGAADAHLVAPCDGEAYFQVDVYRNDQVTRSTITGGVLKGPNDPGESLVPGGWGVAYKVVKVVGIPCEPPAVPWSDAGETFSCDAWTYWTKTGHYGFTFDAEANMWVQDAEPTVDAETSELIPTNYDERQARGCNPELAETGVDYFATWLWAGIGVSVMALGVLLLAIRRVRND